MGLTLPATVWGQHRLEWGQQTYTMGIINVTPDSFSGDGLAQDVTSEQAIEMAVEQARRFVAEGATLIDVGGESTRPRASEVVSVEQELERVIPVIQALRQQLPSEIMISIDTYKAEVAARALDAGACIINDVQGLRYDPAMAAVAAEYHVPVVIMANMRIYKQRHEIVSDVIRYLAGSIELALQAGVAWEHIIIDPGIGFGIKTEESIALLSRLGELRALGRPILLGTSRKSSIGAVLGGLPASERVEGTAATVALGIAQGADIVRVHDVHEMVRVVKMSDAIVRGTFSHL